MGSSEAEKNSAKLSKTRQGICESGDHVGRLQAALWPRPSAPINSRSPCSHVILAISIEIGSELAFGHSRLEEPEIGDERPTRIAASELYARYEAWSDTQGRLVSLPKTRKSGRIWYEHAEFARPKVAEGMRLVAPIPPRIRTNAVPTTTH